VVEGPLRVGSSCRKTIARTALEKEGLMAEFSDSHSRREYHTLHKEGNDSKQQRHDRVRGAGENLYSTVRLA
jgi:hypothetical protein